MSFTISGIRNSAICPNIHIARGRDIILLSRKRLSATVKTIADPKCLFIILPETNSEDEMTRQLADIKKAKDKFPNLEFVPISSKSERFGFQQEIQVQEVTQVNFRWSLMTTPTGSFILENINNYKTLLTINF